MSTAATVAAGDGQAAFRRRQSQAAAKADPCRTGLSHRPRVVRRVPGTRGADTQARRCAHRHPGSTTEHVVRDVRELNCSTAEKMFVHIRGLWRRSVVKYGG